MMNTRAPDGAKKRKRGPNYPSFQMYNVVKEIQIVRTEMCPIGIYVNLELVS